MPFAVAAAVAVPGRPISERHNVRGRCHTTRHGSSLEVPRFVDRVLFSLDILLNNFFWCAPILNVVCSDRGKGTRCRIACVLCLPPVPPSSVCFVELFCLPRFPAVAVLEVRDHFSELRSFRPESSNTIDPRRCPSSTAVRCHRFVQQFGCVRVQCAVLSGNQCLVSGV